MKPSALIIEDHPLYRDALIHLLGDVFEGSEVITAASAEEGLRLATKRSNLRIILIDLNLPGLLSGVDAVMACHRSFPLVGIVVISGSEDRREVAAAFRAGARAFISKHVSRARMKDVICRILAGQLTKPEWIRLSPGSVFANDHTLPLSQRQTEVLLLLARGYTNREIASQVQLAEITVKQHVSVIFRVLGVSNRAQALLAIRRLGLAIDG